MSTHRGRDRLEEDRFVGGETTPDDAFTVIVRFIGGIEHFESPCARLRLGLLDEIGWG